MEDCLARATRRQLTAAVAEVCCDAEVGLVLLYPWSAAAGTLNRSAAVGTLNRSVAVGTLNQPAAADSPNRSAAVGSLNQSAGADNLNRIQKQSVPQGR